MIFEEISRGIPSREPEWQPRRADAVEYATHPRILWMAWHRGTASMSRGHQTGQARIATTSGPGDLQRVTRREFNRAGSNEAGATHRRSFMSPRLSYPDNNEIMRRKWPERDEPHPWTLHDEFLCIQCEKPWRRPWPNEIIFFVGDLRHPFPLN